MKLLNWMKKHWGILSICLIFFMSLALRCLSWESVYADGQFKFNGVDSYYHMRLVDHMVENFPNRLYWDPFTIFPDGSNASWPPFFNFLIALTALIFGWGHPSEFIVNMSGIILPAVMGATLVFPVYFIAKKISGKFAGVIAAIIVSIMPGEILGRSLIGCVDHHVLETLLVALIALFIILSDNSSFKNWKTIICGILLGLYILTWNGAALILVVLLSYMGIKSIFYRKSVLGFSIIFFIAFCMTKLWLAKESETPYLSTILLGISILPIILDILNKRLKGWHFPISIISFCFILLLSIYIIDKDIILFIITQFSFVFSWSFGTSLMEMQPTLFPGAGNKLEPTVLWGNLTTGIFFIFIAMTILLSRLFSRKISSVECFVLIWSIVMCAAMLGQRRFAYYFGVNAAILVGFVAGYFWEEITKYYNAFNIKYRNFKKEIIYKSTYMCAIIISAIIPNFYYAYPLAGRASFLPSDAWINSLNWLRENSPEPFDDPDVYYTTYDRDTFKYPETAYGIMSWWDYGHWITRIAKRLPNASPSSHGSAPTFFSCRDETVANKCIEDLGIEYIIIDYTMSTSKFYAIISLSSSIVEPVEPGDFYDVLYIRDGNNLKPVMVYYPGYFNSVLVRMYNFNCKEYIPITSTVVTYTQQVSSTGISYKLITDVQSFANYEDAVYFASQGRDRKIISPNPFMSPIRIEALKGYTQVYSSPEMIDGQSEIKIFKWGPD